MGDVNVKAYGIYVNGKKAGAVEDKETAAAVLQDIKNMYTQPRIKGAEIEGGRVPGKAWISDSATRILRMSLQKTRWWTFYVRAEEKETVHKVVAGETLADIARLYSMSEEEILDDNENVDPSRLKVGSALVIKQTAPLLRLKVTEKITYEEEVRIRY